MMLKASAWLAVAFGLFLAVAEAVQNWGHWQWWPLWVVDYVAVVLVLIGAWDVLRRDGAGKWLAAGWAFTAGMLWIALAWMVRAGEATWLLTIVGVMEGAAALGLVGALWPRANAP